MKQPKNFLILHLGSNIGNRLKYIETAIAAIEQQIGSVQQRSYIYETAAWGVEDQADFLNIAVEIQTLLSPIQVLETIHQIENRLGRLRSERWGARTIDIDILFYNQFVIETKALTIPHIQIAKRNFVLVPLLDIIPKFIHPVLEVSMEALYWKSKDQQTVKRWKIEN